MDSDTECLLALLLIRRQRRRRLYWVHPILTGTTVKLNLHFDNLLRYPKKFFRHFRMSLATFQELLLVLHDGLIRQNTSMRQSIAPAERLAITLRYLATGCLFGEFETTYYRGASTARMIVKETCQLIG